MLVRRRFSLITRYASRFLLAAGVVLTTVGSAIADEAADKLLEDKILKVIREHPKEIMQAVVTYQREQAEARIKGAETRLKEQVAQLKPAELIGDAPVRGAADSRLVLVEFSDFQCPYCARAFGIVQKFMTAHGQEVRLAYRHLPLGDMHPQATNAALASWAAQQQGKFWEFHDAMFSAQDRLGEDYYLATAKQLGLNIERFNTDRSGAAAKAAIERDVELARKLGIEATPQFIMGSRPITGAAPLQEFEQALVEARGDLK